MPRGRKKKPSPMVEPVEDAPVKSEKDQLTERSEELTTHLAWLDTNKFLDTGEVRRELGRIQVRLSQL